MWWTVEDDAQGGGDDGSLIGGDVMCRHGGSGDIRVWRRGAASVSGSDLGEMKRCN